MVLLDIFTGLMASLDKTFDYTLCRIEFIFKDISDRLVICKGSLQCIGWRGMIWMLFWGVVCLCILGSHFVWDIISRRILKIETEEYDELLEEEEFLDD